MRKFKINPDESTRTSILNISLFIEDKTSAILCELLDINRKESKSFGNTSQALSFNDKVNLLLELNVLNSDDVKLLNSFMYIRNQFIHNISVTSFVNVFNDNEKSKFEKQFFKFEIESDGEKIREIDRKIIIAIADRIAKISGKLDQVVYKKYLAPILAAFAKQQAKIEEQMKTISKAMVNNELITAVKKSEEASRAIGRAIEAANIINPLVENARKIEEAMRHLKGNLNLTRVVETISRLYPPKV
jgi:hypothetical protein